MIHPVLPCGGSGTRRRPLSPKGRPKQFAALTGAETLFQAAVRRVSAPGHTAPVIATASDLRFVMTEQLQEVGVDPGTIRIEAQARKVSIDPAVMEKAANLCAPPYDGAWSDPGDWDAVWGQTAQDMAPNTGGSGPVTAIDCHGTLLCAEAPLQVVVGLGLPDLVAVAMPDDVLVADRSRAQEVAQLAAQGARQAEVRLLTENESVHVPPRATHRLQNPGKADMVLIEVQTCPSPGEEDILRYDDPHARNRGDAG